MEAVIQLGGFVLLLIIGYVFGRRADKKHYASIYQREQSLSHVVLLNGRVPPPDLRGHNMAMVSGNVVISVDYFKTIISGLRSLVGGRMNAYEILIDRARREALLRMQEHAHALNADAVINLKFETCQVAGNAGKGLGSIEVLAYGTALSPTQS